MREPVIKATEAVRRMAVLGTPKSVGLWRISKSNRGRRNTLQAS
jgi:hypothetical protein